MRQAHLAPAASHYERLLAPIYTWMSGGWGAALAAARDTLQQLGVPVNGRGRKAIDFGCGHGAHVVALGELGYVTTAVDSSAALLHELCHHAPETAVEHDDICHAAKVAHHGHDLVLCLGDTLTHLGSPDQVDAFLGDCAALLSEGGMLAISLRDYRTGRAAGDSAVFFVRSDAQRMLTCCVDYREDTVRVTDIVHEAGKPGWSGRSSHCDKLRLPPDFVAARLRHAGLAVRVGSLNGGMTSIVAVRAVQSPGR